MTPLSSNKLVLIGFDRHLYLYELNDGFWEFSKDITKETITKKEENTNSNTADVKKGSIFDRMKVFDKAHQLQTKSSLVADSGEKNDSNTGKVSDKLHKALISKAILKGGNTLITADLAGFIREWKF